MPIAAGYGLITVERHPDRDAGWPELYRESLDLVRRAEALGLESVWTTEHHFVDSGYLPAPLVLSAAFAAVTERVRIGTGVILAPLYHPLWIAEEAAVVDNLADGRLILGMGLGWSRTEFEGFGSSITTRGRWLEEMFDILEQAGRDDVIRHEGPLIQVPEVAIRPRPARGRLTTWVGAHADVALQRAARHADGILVSSDIETFRHEVAVVQAELERVGRDPTTFEFGQYLTIVPDEGGRDAWEEIGEHVLHADWKYGDMEPSARRAGEPIPRRGEMSGDDMAESRRYCITGPVDAVVDRLEAYAAIAPGPFHAVARNYLPGLSAAAQMELLERFATQVAPGLR
jgi:alkanesulfonate monooxygenase SsuD/methylene tetrahydromethanopterin reductase-like flavin-dependent oxidoreductase (luciferase family)